MSKTNKKMKDIMCKKYGAKCMFKAAGVEQQIEQLRDIKGYRVFIQERHYTSKQIARMEHCLTYHHLKHRSEGGHTTEENGAIVNGLAHAYMHGLPRQHEEVINNMLRQYKLNFGALVIDERGNIEMNGQQIAFETEDYVVIPVYDNNGKTISDFVDEQRRKEKTEMQKLRKQYEDR